MGKYTEMGRREAVATYVPEYSSISVKGSLSIFPYEPLYICMDHVPIHQPLTHMRRILDFNTFSKYLRHWCISTERSAVGILDAMDIQEIAHAYYGPEFGWWENSTFTFEIREALQLMPKEFLEHIFADGKGAHCGS